MDRQIVMAVYDAAKKETKYLKAQNVTLRRKMRKELSELYRLTNDSNDHEGVLRTKLRQIARTYLSETSPEDAIDPSNSDKNSMTLIDLLNCSS